MIEQQAHKDRITPLPAKVRMCHLASEAVAAELASDEMPSFVLLRYTTLPSPGGNNAKVNRKNVPIHTNSPVTGKPYYRNQASPTDPNISLAYKMKMSLMLTSYPKKS